MTSVRNLLAICATSGFLVFSRAEASAELSHDIAAQPLAQALSEFASSDRPASRLRLRDRGKPGLETRATRFAGA